MQRFLLSSSPPFLLLSLLFLSSFHSRLVSAQGFNGPIDKSSLTFLENGSVDSSGTLTLDSSGGDAQAFHGKPVSLLDEAGVSVLSFSSIFTFASNATSGNGSIVYAFVPDATGTVSLTEARKTLTIEFNTSCSTGVYNRSGFPGWGGYQGRGGGWGGGGGGFGGFGGLGGFQVAEYANTTSIPSSSDPSGYGPGWDNSQPPAGNYFCSQQPPQDIPNPTFQYQVAIDYNASTQNLWVGSPSCGAAFARTTQFNVQNLSGIILKSVYVGFLVSGGGTFNITQWNFTTNTNTNSALNLALSSTASTTPGSSPANVNGGGMRDSNGGLKKGYVVGFSILGAGIGVAAVFLGCCLCARRKREVTSARFVGKGVHRGTIPESAVVFDAKKPNAPPAKVVLVDRDTAPLNTHANSAFHGSTGAASWLQPVAPR